MSGRSQTRIPRRLARALLLSFAILLTIVPIASAALPGAEHPATDRRNQTPGWMTPDIVNRLANVGAPVLAPSYLPGAVSFLPSVDAYSGYYSFYWLVPGTPPTYLHITGTVGGSIPAYSKYDRNVPLTQNAFVLGTPAYHDLTPIYDLVYFAIGGVVYSVESNNIADTSLGIANSLAYVDLPVWEPDPPVQEPSTPPGSNDGSVTSPESPATTSPIISSPTIVVPGVAYSEEMIVISVAGVAIADLTASDGSFTLTGDGEIAGALPGGFEWIPPRTQAGRTVRFTLTDPGNGEILATETLRVEPTPEDQIPVSADRLSCPVTLPMGSLGGIEIAGSGQLTLDASDGSFPDIGPNSTFAGQSDVDGSDVLNGVIRTQRSAWVFFEPAESSAEYTTYIFLQNRQGTTLLECGIEIVLPVNGESYPNMGSQDGTGAVGGVAVAVLGDTPEGTNVHTPEMPGLGYKPDGTLAAIPSYPWSDGTSVTTTADTAPPPVTSDGTAIEEPVSANDDGS